MVFTTQIFLFFFFPAAVLLYVIASAAERAVGKFNIKLRLRLKDAVLAALSLAFYAWACFDDAIKLLIYVAAVYIAGRITERMRESGKYLMLYRDGDGGAEKCGRVPLSAFPWAAAVAVVLAILAVSKYAGFFGSVIGTPLASFSSSASGATAPVAMLGISFLSFSAVSYITDIKRGEAAGSLLDCILYITFFPKVISGPVVPWHDFSPQIKNRKITVDAVSDGLCRIMTGVAKKVILADTFGGVIADIGAYDTDGITAAGTVLLYMLQIYYDFSGYSDIAIGLSKLFGFTFKENFDFPYLSRSITEFWRRWHISLGAWFREYVYIPLGGSRRGMRRTLFNLGVVFILTGLWHGAGWNYIIWGAANGAIVIIERIIREKNFYKKTPDAVKWLITMNIVMLMWQLFRFESLRECARLFAVIFGFITNGSVFYTWQHYFDSRIVTFVLIGMVGASLFGLPAIRERARRFSETAVGSVIYQLGLTVLFVISILYIVNSVYVPFLYFRY